MGERTGAHVEHGMEMLKKPFWHPIFRGLPAGSSLRQPAPALVLPALTPGLVPFTGLPTRVFAFPDFNLAFQFPSANPTRAGRINRSLCALREGCGRSFFWTYFGSCATEQAELPGVVTVVGIGQVSMVLIQPVQLKNIDVRHLQRLLATLGASPRSRNFPCFRPSFPNLSIAFEFSRRFPAFFLS